MRHLSTWTRAAVALACLGLSAEALAAEAAQKVGNLVPFDLASCNPRALDLSKPINEFAVQAAFRSARPFIQECLTDAKNYDGTKPLRGKVNTAVDGAGLKVSATGEGLQPAAKACIEKAVAGQLGTVAPLPADAKPISFDGPFERGPNTGVRMGINEASDVEGTVRLALPQWCSCFDDYKTKAPPQLSGMVTLTRKDMLDKPDRFKLPDGGVPKQLLPVNSALAGPAEDANAAKAAACLNGKVNTLPLTSKAEQFLAPVQLLLVNSNSTEPLPASAAAPLRFVQIDSTREQRQADAFAALGRRQKVADDYDKKVTAYQTLSKSTDAKKRKQAAGMVNELKTGCAALVKSDDEFTAALETQAKVEQQAVELAKSLKATDASWSDAEAAANGAAADTQKQIEAAKQMRTANEKACPKTKY
jgi:hypothetical protein